MATKSTLFALLIGGLAAWSSAFAPAANTNRHAVPGVPAALGDPRIVPAAGRAAALRMWGNDDEIEGQDRIKSCIPYLLPLIDGDHFAKYINLRFPPLGLVDSVTISPLANLVDSVPFLSLILFLVLSLGTRALNLSRPIKFNAQQAVLIDVALIFPELIGGAFEGQRQFVPLMEPCSNFIFYCYMGACLYSISSNLRGKTPDGIPVISNAAKMAAGPY
mmetsp:Transcript_5309/g.15067  ORF Transcript_5309/g.15067 Transcript_5309/m.15067 type:complete len:219 (+) Transcript_5309:147-803(+)